MSGGAEATSQPLRLSVGGKTFVLDPLRRSLSHDGTELILGQQAINVLLVLAGKPGQVVSNQDLMDGAWGGVIVNPTAIRSQVTRIRSVLGPDAIVTIPKHGHQLVAIVRAEETALVRPALSIAELRAAGVLRPVPAPPAELIGRDADLAGLHDLCRRNRLVTIMGLGGVGKTALALEAARRLEALYPDGCVFVDLARALSAADLAAAVARELGVSFGARRDLVDMLAAAIGPRRLLLILDTCEYVAEPVAALIAQLAVSCPNLGMLATTQKALPIAGAGLYALQPLALDQSVALFCLRAATEGPSWSESERDKIDAICSRMDGLPLVVEMAAARSRSVGLDKVRAGLGDRFALLDHASEPGKPGRQRTLSAVLAWTYGLLTPDSQHAFRRLSCLAGTLSVDGVQAVLAAFQPDVTINHLHKVLSELFDCSLLVRTGGGNPRYGMLESVQEFAVARLIEAGEAEATAEAHARYFTRLFQAAAIKWATMPDPEWVETYGAELDNLRQARDWVLGRPDRLPLAIDFLGAAGPLWLRLGLAAEIRPAIDHVAALVTDETPLDTAAALFRAAAMIWRHADRPRALAFNKRAAAAYRQLGDETNLGTMLTWIGGDHIQLGHYDEARPVLEEAYDLLQQAPPSKPRADIENELGRLAMQTNDLAVADRHYTMVRKIGREIKDGLREGIALSNLGEVEFQYGVLHMAIELTQESAAILRQLGQVAYLGDPLLNMAGYCLLSDRLEEAKQHALEAFPLVSSGGFRLRLFLHDWALIIAREGRHVQAAQLSGFVDAEYARTGTGRERLGQGIHDVLTSELRAHLSETDIAIAARHGSRWTEDFVVGFVRNMLMS